MSGHSNIFNTFDTGGYAKKKNSKDTKTWYPAADYPIGLTFFDYDYARDIRIKTYFDNVKYNETDETFNASVHIDVPEETVVYNTGCTWLDDFKHDRDFQHGKLTLKPDQLTKDVSFPLEFTSQPAVIVWLSGFDVGHIIDWRFSVNATDITTKGFKIVGNIWGTTKLNSVEATWIAYPASRPNIDSGWFNTADVRDKTKPRHENSQQIKFEKNFERVPRVYFAFNLLDVSSQNATANLRLKAYISDTTTTGMTAHLDSWYQANMNSTAGQWIAIQDY